MEKTPPPYAGQTEMQPQPQPTAYPSPQQQPEYPPQQQPGYPPQQQPGYPPQQQPGYPPQQQPGYPPQQQPGYYPQQAPQIVVAGMGGDNNRQMPGQCPVCRAGMLNREFSVIGILCAIVLFPVGLVCLFLMKKTRCTMCRASF